jgi:hypothetical protein
MKHLQHLLSSRIGLCLVPDLDAASAFVKALRPMWSWIDFYKSWPSLASRAPELSMPHFPGRQSFEHQKHRPLHCETNSIEIATFGYPSQRNRAGRRPLAICLAAPLARSLRETRPELAGRSCSIRVVDEHGRALCIIPVDNI